MNPRIIPFAFAIAAIAAACISACKSDADRCHEAQVAAQQAWSAYVQASTKRKPQIANRLANAHIAMRRMSKALSAAATEEANKLYDRGSAWQRHFEVALTQACRRDPDCAAIEKERDHAKADADAIDGRIALATAARKQAVSDPESAWLAAEAVELEPKIPASVAADLAAKAAADTCGIDRGL